MSRCVARTKDFERCRNDAERGSIFCRRHRWWWLITLFGVIVAVTTIGSNIATMFGVTFPNPFLSTATLTPTKRLIPSFTPVFHTETPALTITSSAIQTMSSIPSETQTRTMTVEPTSTSTHTPTATPLALENYGGLDRNCIPDRYWDFATSENIQSTNGCLQIQKWGFYADEQTIIIKQPSPKVQAGDLEVNLYYSLVDRFEPPFDIFFKVYIENFGGSESSTVSPLFSIGLCDPANWQSSFKMVSFSSQNDSIQRGILVDQQETWYRNFDVLGIMETKSYSLVVDLFRAAIFEDAHYASKMGEQLWGATITPDERSALCIQYRMPINGELVATISDLRIDSR